MLPVEHLLVDFLDLLLIGLHTLPVIDLLLLLLIAHGVLATGALSHLETDLVSNSLDAITWISAIFQHGQIEVKPASELIMGR